jgi:hypothetical protein
VGEDIEREGYIAHSVTIAGECHFVAEALHGYARRILLRRTVIRAMNFLIGSITIFPPLIWIATKESTLVQGFGEEFQRSASAFVLLLAFVPAAVLLIGTAYFAAFEKESPERVRDWAEYLVMYANWIEELGHLRPDDVLCKLEVYVSLANINMNHAAGRWGAASNARRLWRNRRSEGIATGP